MLLNQLSFHLKMDTSVLGLEVQTETVHHHSTKVETIIETAHQMIGATKIELIIHCVAERQVLFIEAIDTILCLQVADSIQLATRKNVN